MNHILCVTGTAILFAFQALANEVLQDSQRSEHISITTHELRQECPLIKNRMTHILNTDVWYKSWIVPRNSRTVYCISPDDPLIAISDYRLDLLRRGDG
jgi:hypothetical protein